MLLYLLLLYIILVHCIANIRRSLNSKIELFFMLIGIFIVLAFRDVNSGTDTWNYLANFQYIKKFKFESLSLISNQEIGFLIFEWCLGQMFPNSTQVLFIAQGIIVVVSYGYYIYRYCKKNYFLAILGFMTFGLFGFHITGVRQSIAMSICIWAYVLYDKNKYIWGTIIVIIACQFHLSAIVTILYLVYGKGWRKGNNLFTTIIVGGIMAIGAGTILDKVSMFSERWGQYSNIESTGNGQIFFVILIIIVLLGETLDKASTEYQYSKRINYLSLIFWTGRLVTRSMQRPAMYFYPANLTILVNGIEDYKHVDSKKILKIGSFICITFLYLYRFHGYTYNLINLF